MLDYDFRTPDDSVQAMIDLTRYIPSNLHSINEALARSRDDLPNINAWRDYCNYAWNVSSAGQEDEVGPLLATQFTRDIAKGNGRSFQKARMVDIVHLLPAGHLSLRPDRLGGMWPMELGTHIWLAPALKKFIPMSNMICVNEVYEFKSSSGDLSKAVSPTLVHFSA